MNLKNDPSPRKVTLNQSRKKLNVFSIIFWYTMLTTVPGVGNSQSKRTRELHSELSAAQATTPCTCVHAYTFLYTPVHTRIEYCPQKNIRQCHSVTLGLFVLTQALQVGPGQFNIQDNVRLPLLTTN